MSIDHIRFLWIFLCFLLSFWQGVPLAALFTLCADFFLLFTPFYASGLFCFLLVQLAYLQNLRSRPFPVQTLLLLPLGILLPVPFLGILYAFLFCCHLIFTIKKAQPRLSHRLYLCGLLLFICCDITVAWGYFRQPLPPLIWFFYAPSQLLLALTARRLPLLP